MHITASDISKRYGKTQALDNVSLSLTPGRVHALVGENGAGKSTLLKIICGVEKADAGRILVDDQPFSPSSAAVARAQGIELIFQEVTINPALSVAENIFIDRFRQYRGRLGLVDYKKMKRDAQTVLDRIDARVSVNQNLADLDLGQWKCIEICRALSTNPQAILLDESTAFLSRREVSAVLAAIAGLKQEGLAVAFISHHLDEVFDVADSLTVLKDGQTVGNYHIDEVDHRQLQALMVGREINTDIYPAHQHIVADSTRLSLRNFSVVAEAPDFDLDLSPGEILGIAGLKGAGGEKLVETIIGDRAPLRGRMTIEDKTYAPISPSDSWDSGIAYLPGDRTGEGLISIFNLLDNLTLAAMPRTGLFFAQRQAADMAQNQVDDLRINTNGIEAPVNSLSGGNMQKVVLGKCLAAQPRILVLNNPTRGVDVGARAEIYLILETLVCDGLSVLLLSEDLSELIGMSDRIAVIRNGQLARIFYAAESPSENDIVQHML